PVAQTPVDDTQVSETPVATPADPSALSDFFELLSDFLRSVSNGFDLDSGNGSFRYFYSESFKLEILKAVIHTAAPAESTDTAANVEQLIDSINANETLDAKSPQ
ncbi:MAG: hypothetical protein OES99_08900, partial [Gammaproteobacteria bacterium]|nr:hypothetical protein [Gammaproteobacteria bacterium]